MRLPSPRAAVLLTASGIVLSLALLAAAAVNAHAQEGSPKPSRATATGWVHESWTVEDGLPVNAIGGLIQGRAGYIWAATYDGLVRFDGVRFTTFNSANSESELASLEAMLPPSADGPARATPDVPQAGED